MNQGLPTRILIFGHCTLRDQISKNADINNSALSPNISSRPYKCSYHISVDVSHSSLPASVGATSADRQATIERTVRCDQSRLRRQLPPARTFGQCGLVFDRGDECDRIEFLDSLHRFTELVPEKRILSSLLQLLFNSIT